jgi:hypothetical protein
MAKEYDFELVLNNREYASIMDIRGMPDGAHTMRMCAKIHEDGWILRGSHDDFDGLLQVVDEEIEEGLAPKKNLPALRRVRNYITPTEDNGLE